MYSNSNNRIITKYSDFLREHSQEVPIPHQPKKVIDNVNETITNNSSNGELVHDTPSSSPPPSYKEPLELLRTVSAQIHSPKNFPNSQLSSPTGPVHESENPEPIFSSSKFSEIFSSEESHAIQQRNILLRSEAGRFILESLATNNKNNSAFLRNLPFDIEELRKLSQSKAVDESEESDGEIEDDNNIEKNPTKPLPVSYPRGNEFSQEVDGYLTQSEDDTNSTGADLNSVTMRRDLLNNIRAISRATFYEDIYVNNGRERSLEADLNHPEKMPDTDKIETVSNKYSAPILIENGELLVFKNSENEKNEPSLPFNYEEESPEAKRESIDRWIQSSQENINAGLAYDPTLVNSEPNLSQNDFENTIRRNSTDNSGRENILPTQINPIATPLASSLDNFNIKSSLTPRVDLALPPPVAFSETSYSRKKKLKKVHDQFEHKALLHKKISKQVHYPQLLPKRLSPLEIPPSDELNLNFRPKNVPKNLPGVLMRTNMDQWVAKIVRFYVNGDEHRGKFELRFRPGRDVHSFDGLCDMLSGRLQLSRGVRFIFTLTGRPVWLLEHLKHDGAYVVSSTRKFKPLNYGHELDPILGELNPTISPTPQLKPLNAKKKRRPPSAPSNRNPPIITLRREPSLNGVAWGSPQALSNSSEENNSLVSKVPQNRRSAIEAQKVLLAAIEQSQPVHRQVIRVINGTDPGVQSQVLLNTRVSQEWSDLVKDLAQAVKVPRNYDCRLETLDGKQVQSYSQLRSQLKSGNMSFYIQVNFIPTESTSGRISSLSFTPKASSIHNPPIVQSVQNLPLRRKVLSKSNPNIRPRAVNLESKMGYGSTSNISHRNDKNPINFIKQNIRAISKPNI